MKHFIYSVRTKKCADDEILNPATNRCVKKSGKIGKELLKKQAARTPSPKKSSPKKKKSSPKKVSPKKKTPSPKKVSPKKV
jgi:hypothetical protein